MKLVIGCLIVYCLAIGVLQAQFDSPRNRTLTVTIIGADADPRLEDVGEAVSYWNKTLEELGSGLRLGPVTRVSLPISEDALQSMSQAVVAGPRVPLYIPTALRSLPGDLNVILGNSAFISFAATVDGSRKRIVGIRGADVSPMNFPNVARNVIAHEIGHALGLGHNSDPTKLMCGRPAACRPGLFRSEEPRMFPLTEGERHQLVWMYPADSSTNRR